MPTVLLTGGTGYIGSHTCVELINARFDTILFDNLCNSSPVVIDRIEKITKRRPVFVRGDVRDHSALDRTFEKHRIDAVVHFAGLKAVAESVVEPLAYYLNNVSGSATLFDVMRNRNVHRIVFSSSATVYDPEAEMPLKETSPTGPTNPYGHTKLVVEQMLHDLAHADPRWRMMCLRYFNPVGAHESGLIGEDPRGTPNNLMPYLSQVAAGALPLLRIFGNDYPTRDGTGVRDYIHVTDLAKGHVAAIDQLFALVPLQDTIINLGTGRGYTVLEVIREFCRVTGRNVLHEIVDRRAGDIAASYADVTLARDHLHWVADRGLHQMCADTWRWQSANPCGYDGRTQC